MATAGAGALALGGAAMPAVAEESNGTEAVDFNVETDRFELAAAHTSQSADELEQLEAAGQIAVTDNGTVIYGEPVQADALTAAPLSNVDIQAAPGTPEEGSRPGAPVTIFLDFDGETLTGTSWNDVEGVESLELAGAAIADADFRAAVWASVAEDYAPFNVNVTTVDPGQDALVKEDEGDDVYGAHVIITDSYKETLPNSFAQFGNADLGGLAAQNAVGSDYRTGALVFVEGLGGAQATAKAVSEAAAHEAGHNFGLGHDGFGDDEYYMPLDGLWGPIQGAGYEVPVTQWSNGGYNGASNDEDDLSIITDRSVAGALFMYGTHNGEIYDGPVCAMDGADPRNPQPGDVFLIPEDDGYCYDDSDQLELHFTYVDRAEYVADDHGDDIDGATAVDNATGDFEVAGLIEQNTDVDVFEIVTAGGDISATVDVADVAANLNAQAVLTDADGNILSEDAGEPQRVSASEASGLGATVSASDVDAGAYYVHVTGVGFGNPDEATVENSNGFTEYGSLGNYTVSGQAEPFVTEDIVITSPADGAEVELGDVEVTGTATPGATVSVEANGETVTVEADENGAWTATVSAAYGNTEIVASQSVDGIDVPGTDSVTVTVPVDAPVIGQPEDGSSTEDTTPVVSGTGIPGATVTVIATGTNGEEITVETEVDAEGNWEVELPEVAAGTLVITANQTINGVTSANSETVTLTVTVEDGDDDDNGSGDDENGDELPETGFDLGFAPYALLALLLMGAGAAALALRNRSSV